LIVFNAVLVAWRRAVERLATLVSDVARSDGAARPSPYAAANTALSHEAIGLWTALGLLTAGAVAVAFVVGDLARIPSERAT
jgi:hypothetical protein